MEETHPPDCREFCCSDFANMPDDLLDDPPEGQLNNDIHTLFDQARFTSGNKAMTNGTYRRLKQMLRLASRLLTDDRATQFIVAMVDGTIHEQHDIDSERGPEVTAARIDSSRITTEFQRYPNFTLGTVTQTMRERSAVILQNLANVFKGYIIVGNDEDGPKAVCRPMKSETAGQFTDFARGCKSQITIKKGHILPPKPAFMNANAQRSHRLAGSYILARSLVHELSHALNFAVNHIRDPEIFYNNSVLSEAGFDLECALFNGRASVYRLDSYSGRSLQGHALLQDHYPSQRVLEIYQAANLAMGGPRGPLPFAPYMLMTRLPWSWVRGLFTDAFWEIDVPNMWPGPIQPAESMSQWTIRPVLSGENFINSAGTVVSATTDIWETTTTTDPGIPQNVKDKLTEIWNLRELRRTGVSPAAAI